MFENVKTTKDEYFELYKYPFLIFIRSVYGWLYRELLNTWPFNLHALSHWKWIPHTNDNFKTICPQLFQHLLDIYIPYILLYAVKMAQNVTLRSLFTFKISTLSGYEHKIKIFSTAIIAFIPKIEQYTSLYTTEP